MAEAGEHKVLFEAEKISKAFPGVRALKNASFTLSSGEIHALVGENGAGKSTLIKVLAGVHTPDSGQVRLEGKPVHFGHPVEALAAGISVIYQEPNLFPDLTVAENVFAGHYPRRKLGLALDWPEMTRVTQRLLDGLAADIGPLTPVNRLSAANRQIVAIARALNMKARVLIMDEPTASLSDREIERLFGIMRQLRTQGVGIIFISHRLDEIFQVASQVTVMRDGEVVGTFLTQAVDRDQLIALMVGRGVGQLYPKTPGVTGDLLLEVENLRLKGHFGPVSLTVHRGEIVGLFGLVGAGRSEVAQTLFGITPAEDGEVRLEGKPLAIHSPTQAIGAGLAYLPEDRQMQGLVLPMTVMENISLAVLRAVARGRWVDRAGEESLAERYISLMGIKTPGPRQAVAALSGGNQQKVVLGKWLASRPKVLILDEPTRGVDVGAKAEIHRHIDRLAHEGLGVILISSDLPEVLGMSDRVVVMREGRITGELSREAATQESVLRLAFSDTVPAA